MSEAIDLINELSSGDRSKEEYISVHEEMLDNLDRIERAVDEVEIGDIKDFQDAMEKKGILSSLFCYSFNNDKDEHERVSEVEGKLGDKLYDFAKSFRKIKDGELRSVAKYLITCWDRYFRYEEQENIIRKVHENDKLRRTYGEDYVNYFVIGLHYNVGDNTFTIASDGSENRNYVRHCGIQAFYVRSHFHDKIKELERKGMGIPELEDYYSKVSVMSDRKEAARVYLSRKDKRVIRKKYTS